MEYSRNNRIYNERILHPVGMKLLPVVRTNVHDERRSGRPPLSEFRN